MVLLLGAGADDQRFALGDGEVGLSDTLGGGDPGDLEQSLGARGRTLGLGPAARAALIFGVNGRGGAIGRPGAGGPGDGPGGPRPPRQPTDNVQHF